MSHEVRCPDISPALTLIFRLLTQTAISEALKAAEEKDWEARLEEYCRAREEGVEVLKELGHTDFQVCFHHLLNNSTDSHIAGS